MSSVSSELSNALGHALRSTAAANELISVLEVSNVLSSTEAGFIDGAVAGTPAASKAVVLDASSNVGSVGNLTIATAKTLAVTDADKLTVGGLIVPQKVTITHKINPANTSGEFCFVADRAYTILSIKEIHNVVAGQACACSIRKLTSDAKLASDAIGTGIVDLLASDLDLTSTAATTVTASLSAVAGALNLAAGDKIGVKMGNGSSLVGGNLTITLKAI